MASMPSSSGPGRRRTVGSQLTQGLARVLFPKELADRRGPVERFDLGDPLVEVPMQRAQAVPMRGDPQWTAFDPLQGIDGIDHIQDRQFVQRVRQDKPPVQASLRSTNPARPRAWRTLDR